jgi:multiple sugar transport system substrate-binding protein
MYLGPAVAVTEFRKINNFEWDVAPVPAGSRQVATLTVGLLCINQKTRHPLESWEFVKFYSGIEGQCTLAERRNAIPALKSAAYSSIFLDPPPDNMKVLVDAVEYSETEPEIAQWDEIRKTIFTPGIEIALISDRPVRELMHGIADQITRKLKSAKSSEAER